MSNSGVAGHATTETDIPEGGRVGLSLFELVCRPFQHRAEIAP